MNFSGRKGEASVVIPFQNRDRKDMVRVKIHAFKSSTSLRIPLTLQSCLVSIRAPRSVDHALHATLAERGKVCVTCHRRELAVTALT